MDDGGQGVEEGVATGRRGDVERATRLLRESLQLGGRLRPDDAEELSDHYRACVEDLIQQGFSASMAIEEARDRLGSVTEVIDEMARVRRPPHFFHRWCTYLVGITVILSCWTLLQVVFGLARAAWYTDVPQHLRLSVVISLVGCSIGMGLTTRIAFRFGLFGGNKVTAAAGKGFTPFLYIGGLGFTLLCGLIFADYWEWWVATLSAGGSPQPWNSVFPAIVLFVLGPMAALTSATLLARWHPALASLTGSESR